MNETIVKEKTNVLSFGIILYKMLFGETKTYVSTVQKLFPLINLLLIMLCLKVEVEKTYGQI